MLGLLKRCANLILRPLDHEVSRIRAKKFGQSLDEDLVRLVPDKRPVTVFDVGANVGQTVRRFRSIWQDPIIHCFEPGTDAFPRLRESTRVFPNIHLNNLAVGAHAGTKVLFQFSASESYMNSFLAPDRECWTSVVDEISVPLVTIDAYCEDNGIQHVDVCKIDTQGFDSEVLKGAYRTVANGGIDIIQTEIMFSELYCGQPSFEELYSQFRDMDFSLFALYDWTIRAGRAGNVDALFVYNNYRETLRL